MDDFLPQGPTPMGFDSSDPSTSDETAAFLLSETDESYHLVGWGFRNRRQMEDLSIARIYSDIVYPYDTSTEPDPDPDPQPTSPGGDDPHVSPPSSSPVVTDDPHLAHQAGVEPTFPPVAAPSKPTRPGRPGQSGSSGRRDPVDPPVVPTVPTVPTVPETGTDSGADPGIDPEPDPEPDPGGAKIPSPEDPAAEGYDDPPIDPGLPEDGAPPETGTESYVTSSTAPDTGEPIPGEVSSDTSYESPENTSPNTDYDPHLPTGYRRLPESDLSLNPDFRYDNEQPYLYSDLGGNGDVTGNQTWPPASNSGLAPDPLETVSYPLRPGSGDEPDITYIDQRSLEDAAGWDPYTLCAADTIVNAYQTRFPESELDAYADALQEAGNTPLDVGSPERVVEPDGTVNSYYRLSQIISDKLGSDEYVDVSGIYESVEEAESAGADLMKVRLNTATGTDTREHHVLIDGDNTIDPLVEGIELYWRNTQTNVTRVMTLDWFQK